MKSSFIHTALWLVLATAARGQSSSASEPQLPTSLRVALLADTSARVFNEDSAVAKSLWSADTVIRPGKSTTVALLASMIVPGAGQVYNGAYWKAPVIWGLEYYFISVYKNQDKLYKQYRDLSNASLDSLSATGEERFQLEANSNITIRNFYRNQRDTFGWYVAIAYLVNLLDAYVDASLYNFEVSPNLQPTNPMVATVHIHF